MAKSPIAVRRSAEADYEAIREVLLDAYGEYAHVLGSERWELYKADILASVDDAAVKARLIAELDGRIVGSVFLFDSAEAAYGSAELGIHTPIIRLLAVSRQTRGLGVATELLRASGRLALAWGADTLHLHTSDVMAAAVRLYERLGFERAYDKEFMNGDLLIKSYRLHLREAALLRA